MLQMVKYIYFESISIEKVSYLVLHLTTNLDSKHLIVYNLKKITKKMYTIRCFHLKKTCVESNFFYEKLSQVITLK
jgi:hypothetical protein